VERVSERRGEVCSVLEAEERKRPKYLVQMNENAHPPGTPGFVTTDGGKREEGSGGEWGEDRVVEGDTVVRAGMTKEAVWGTEGG